MGFCYGADCWAKEQVYQMITQEELKLILHYDPLTGVFTRASSTHSQLIGAIAGNVDRGGYRRIHIKGKRMAAHRLAWFYIHGDWPLGDIDHINGNKDDNRIVNLRDVSTRDNTNNQFRHREGKLVGCYYVKKSGRYASQITWGEVVYYLGTYDTEQEASDVYTEMVKCGEQYTIAFVKRFKHKLPRGISYRPSRGIYVVQAPVNGKQKHIKNCKTLEEAIEINKEVRAKLCLQEA